MCAVTEAFHNNFVKYSNNKKMGNKKKNKRERERNLSLEKCTIRVYGISNKLNKYDNRVRFFSATLLLCSMQTQKSTEKFLNVIHSIFFCLNNFILFCLLPSSSSHSHHQNNIDVVVGLLCF